MLHDLIISRSSEFENVSTFFYTEKDLNEFIKNETLSTTSEGLSFLHQIVYPNKTELKKFIKNHQENIPLILHACHVAVSVCEKSAQLSLEVEQDPDSPHHMLCLTIRQEEYSTDIHEQIREIRERYRSAGFIDTVDFIVTTDYQPPLADI